jgi:hypothetical protein
LDKKEQAWLKKMKVQKQELDEALKNYEQPPNRKQRRAANKGEKDSTIKK